MSKGKTASFSSGSNLKAADGEAAATTNAGAVTHRRLSLDAADFSGASPRAVTRGESPKGLADQVVDSSWENDSEGDFGGGSKALQTRTRRRRGSVRVNLSVPGGMDDVLSGLAELTGSSKASFVMEALHAYLPSLKRRLSDHNQLHYPRIRRPQAVPAKEEGPEPQYFLHLSRQARRKLERDQKKAEARGGGS